MFINHFEELICLVLQFIIVYEPGGQCPVRNPSLSQFYELQRREKLKDIMFQEKLCR